MKTLLLFGCLAGLALRGVVALAQPAAQSAVVAVTGGRIVGTLTSDGVVHIYRGIPFAAPPTGNRRWKAPQAVLPWPGVRQCDQFGASPMQSSPAPFGPWSAEYLIPKQPISEDCLYLNVWSASPTTGPASAHPKRPAASRPQERLPVLVWIYGGGFSSGGSGVPIYDGEAMARKGIVFVSFNYRVGPFGFLAHPELTHESNRNASGNYGLMDQIAALQWVQHNIAGFGGDPTKVTIAGQSAGSMSVNCLVASPLAKGLFTKAIAQSGASFGRPAPTRQQAEATGLRLAQALGASSLAELRAKPAGAILQQAPGMRGPIIDGYVLPQSVADIFAAGQQNQVTLLTGWNQDEGLLSGPPKSALDYRHQTEQQYPAHASAFLRHYPATTDDEAARSQREAARDLTFGAPTYAWASRQSQQGKPVYVYRFTRKLPATGPYTQYGAFHTGEVAYAYDNLRFIDHRLRPLEQTDNELAWVMSSYWANFIKTGNPNGKALPPWPTYIRASQSVLVLGDHVGAQPLPEVARLDFLLGLMCQSP